MMLVEGGIRIEQLKMVLENVCSIYQLANPKGVTSVKFLNRKKGYQNFKKANINLLDKDIKWDGMTRIGSMLNEKIINKMIFPPTPKTGAAPAAMKKPLLVIVLTDGDVCFTHFTESLRSPGFIRRVNGFLMAQHSR